MGGAECNYSGGHLKRHRRPSYLLLIIDIDMPHGTQQSRSVQTPHNLAVCMDRQPYNSKELNSGSKLVFFKRKNDSLATKDTRPENPLPGLPSIHLVAPAISS